jgi:hypothetical protein
MTATLERPTIRQDIWAKSLPALPRAAAKPDAPNICTFIGEWLALLATDPRRGGEFDRELESYACTLRASGAFTEHQGAGFALALWSYTNVGNPLQETLRQQVDRRAALRGLRHCKWRGTVNQTEYYAPQNDDALRRAGLPRKGEEGYQPRREERQR